MPKVAPKPHTANIAQVSSAPWAKLMMCSTP